MCIIIGAIGWQMKPTNSGDLIRMLVDAGYGLVRVKGSHHHFKKPGRAGIVTVPHPKKDLPAGTVNTILKVAGLK